MRRIIIFGLAIVFITVIGCASFQNHDTRHNGSREWRGVIEVGVVAIGGETTGIILHTDNGVFELKILDPALLEATRNHDGQRVKIKGLLKIFSGLEIPIRTVIEVKTITFVK